MLRPANNALIKTSLIVPHDVAILLATSSTIPGWSRFAVPGMPTKTHAPMMLKCAGHASGPRARDIMNAAVANLRTMPLAGSRPPLFDEGLASS
jgi:hypothetical protein